MMNKLASILGLSLISISPLLAEETLVDSQYVVIELIESYEIALASNFSYIQAIINKNLNPPQYNGECFNSVTITANTPVTLEVSLGDHTLTNLDNLMLDITPPKNGLSRKITLWNGADAATQEQIALGIEGENLEFRIKLNYLGDAKTSKEPKGAWVFFTILADDENF